MLELSTFQWVVLILFILMCIHYIIRVKLSYSDDIKGVEGFESQMNEGFGSRSNTRLNSSEMNEGFGDLEKTDSLYTWTTDPALIYDDIYAEIYDQLTLCEKRLAAETALCVKAWTGAGETHSKPEKWSVLDVGCGTGIVCQAFAKMGAGVVVGLDMSPAMLRRAKLNIENNTNLTDEQKEVVTWRQDNAYHVNACSLGEFTHVTVTYFSLYYMKDKELFFRHLHGWTKPGARMAIEVVNKHKFDPMLESASPFIFSLQKYADKRLKKSVVKFNKMEYEGDFDIDPDDENKAEFREVIQFTEKGGSVRRNKHLLYMQSFPQIITDAEHAHWKYVGFQDLLPIGFEYAYLLMFERDDSV